eukprot:COSAG06_NODE_4421_length_4284_cov_3.703943_5_plen_88_part_00
MVASRDRRIRRYQRLLVSRAVLFHRWRLARAVKQVALVRDANPAPTQTARLPNNQKEGAESSEREGYRTRHLVNCERLQLPSRHFYR